MACVSIRRADLGLSEPPLRSASPRFRRGFNPPGGFGAFGTLRETALLASRDSFNPPGGFGAFGTAGGGMDREAGNVSIRRADLGLSEQQGAECAHCQCGRFNPPGGFGAFGTTPAFVNESAIMWVSIRRADLGLSERFAKEFRRRANSGFQSAGRIWGFRNRRPCLAKLAAELVSIRRADLGLSELSIPVLTAVFEQFQSAGRIWGFRNLGYLLLIIAAISFNPPGGFGAFGT
ncbi:hypothetical protein OSCT_0304 [Oscillochloris trichoides DG-6]|uniref:Uncharacterized protein n=1 Tax=Oscillochloris trichoides DG-6 TaxID=765420 RepID=E1IAF3_9CHLR|nr:hypothetical protein OSCT_0304 [Oscillochloris trichoides DG-6]